MEGHFIKRLIHYESPQFNWIRHATQLHNHVMDEWQNQIQSSAIRIYFM